MAVQMNADLLRSLARSSGFALRFGECKVS